MKRENYSKNSNKNKRFLKYFLLSELALIQFVIFCLAINLLVLNMSIFFLFPNKYCGIWFQFAIGKFSLLLVKQWYDLHVHFIFSVFLYKM